jgi:hypothetical protein
MVKVPAAQPAPRVPRSRRDDRYDTGHPAPPKRATAGYVVSIQDSYDTVTVDVLDEELTGVIPLGEMPPVGAIVEVEARGDLLVIPTWFPGPPPPPEECTARILFYDYVPAGDPPSTASVTGEDPWGDDASDTYTDSTTVRTESGAFTGRVRAKFDPPAEHGALTGWTLEVDASATNTGTDPGPDFRIIMAFYNAAGDYRGEFSTVLADANVGVLVPTGGTLHTISVPYLYEDVANGFSDALFGGGYLMLWRLNNPGFNTGPFTLSAHVERIDLTITYEC